MTGIGEPDPRESSIGPLAGRVALLTGASGGIGAATARNLIDQGTDLLVSFRTHRDEVDEIIRYGRACGRRVVPAQADLADPDAPAALVERTRAELGGVDILIANAGIAEAADWSAVDVAQWNAALAINLTAPFLLAQQVLPAMVDKQYGRILFMSSVAALNGGVVGPHYAASKAGLHGLVHHLAPRVAAAGVTVNALAPALISGTRMLPADPDSGGLPLPIPVGRLGQVGEVAELAVAILRNGYLSNKVITLDGGLIPR